MALSTTSFEDILARGEAIRAFLVDRGIALNPSSGLNQTLEGVEKAIGYWKAQIQPTDREAEKLVGDLAAIDALGAVVDTVKQSGPMPGLVERLQSMAKGDPRLISQGARSADRDALFELLCWHVCRQFAVDVAFAEPDIRCVYRGNTFGLACKAHYGTTDRAVKAIREGWRQVRGSQVEYGVVMLHLTNHFPHNRMAGANPGDEARLSKLYGENLRSASLPIEKTFLRHLRRNPRPLDDQFQGTLYAAHSLPLFRGAHFRVGGVVFQPMRRDLPEAVWAFVHNVNAFWQDLSVAGTIPL